MSFCPRQHDPSVGRYKSGCCKACHAEIVREHRRKQLVEIREQLGEARYIPELAMVRRRVGVSLKDLAFEASVDVRYLEHLEAGDLAAPRKHRVAILHALLYFMDEKRKAEARDEEDYRRKIMCGIG